MEILPVKKEDAPKLLAIYAPYVRDTAVSFEYDVPSLSEFENRIVTVSGRYPYLKAVENGETIGYAYASAFKVRRAYERAVECSIYVSMDHRKQGIGRALYAALEEELQKMGILNMNACIVYSEQEDEHLTGASVHFHEKMGFTPVGVFHKVGYKFHTWYDMIYMEKHIGEHKIDPEPPLFRDRES